MTTEKRKRENKETVGRFLRGTNRLEWLYFSEAIVYCRKAKRFLHGHGKASATFDIASVSVDIDERGKGWFSDFLDTLEVEGFLGDREYIFVESVIEPRLQGFLAARGYTRSGPEDSPSYYLKVL